MVGFWKVHGSRVWGEGQGRTLVGGNIVRGQEKKGKGSRGIKSGKNGSSVGQIKFFHGEGDQRDCHVTGGEDGNYGGWIRTPSVWMDKRSIMLKPCLYRSIVETPEFSLYI